MTQSDINFLAFKTSPDEPDSGNELLRIFYTYLLHDL